MEVPIESWTVARARLGAQIRHHPDLDHTELRHQLRVSCAADYLRRLVAEAPLSDTERHSLVCILSAPTRERVAS